MRYLITYKENGEHRAFFTNWFDIENNFNAEIEMVVYDLRANQFMDKTLIWLDIKEDSL